MSNGEWLNDKRRQRMKDQHVSKWNGIERRRPELKWARIMTEEVRKLKYQVNSVESIILFLHRELKPKGDDHA